MMKVKFPLYDRFEQYILKRTRQSPILLSDDTYHYMQQPIKRKITLRWILFLLGFFLIGFSIIFYRLGFAFDWLFIWISWEEELIQWNISPMIPIILSIFGIWLISRLSLNPNLLRENTTYIPHLSYRREPLVHKIEERPGMDFVKLRSFPTDRLVAAMLMLSMGVINIVNFGVFLTSENPVGNWMFLGGPSVFFPASFIPMLIAIGLVIYSIGAAAIITFTKTPHLLQIEEYRLGLVVPWMTEIPRDRIRAVRLKNNHTGPKFLWIFILGIHFVQLFEDGIHFLQNPFVFGSSVIVGSAYVITSIIQMIVLVILTVKPQTFLEIITDEKRYELQFSPPAIMPNLIASIEMLFDLPALSEHSRRFRQINLDPPKSVNTQPPLDKNFVETWTNLVTGIGFIFIAIISGIAKIYAGDVFRMVLILFGLYLMLKGFKEEFSSPRHKLEVFHDGQNNMLSFRKEWAFYSEIYRIDRCSNKEYSFSYRLPVLTVIDILMAIIIPFCIGMDITGLIRSIPPVKSTIWLIPFHIIVGLFIFILVSHILIRSGNTLHIQTKDVRFDFNLYGTRTIPQALEMHGLNKWHSFLLRWKSLLHNQPMQILLRSLILVGAILAGIVYGIII